MFFWFVIFFLSAIQAQWNLYDTDPTYRTNQVQYACLYYDVSVSVSGNEPKRLENSASQTIKYCLRPLNETGIINSDFLNVRGVKHTFKELRNLNVTVYDLLKWSAPIDLIERYVVYINQSYTNMSLSKEEFYYCHKQWFGPRCQYSFDIPIRTVEDLVELHYGNRHRFYDDVRYRTTNPSCYTHLQCNRGSPLCLDWREICDGRIDCIDGGADEMQCFELEVNECGDDEYRCRNGMCIPMDFFNDDEENPDCLDLSDEPGNTLNYTWCSNDPRFRCEDKTCPSESNSFPCGDGQCVKYLHGMCVNGRNNLMKESLIANGNLSNSCWLLMICSTFLIDENICESLSYSYDADEVDMSSCESIFQFPIIPVFDGHVRFLYDKHKSSNNMSENNTFVQLPDYVCYNAELCDFMKPTIYRKNLACRYREEIIGDDLSYSDFLMFIRSYFSYCKTPSMITMNEQYGQNLSMYCCENSSKCISKHRLMDRRIDCRFGDDEDYKFSCLLNDTSRFTCNDQEKICWSPTINRNICVVSNQKQRLNEILFRSICDGIVHLLPQNIDGQNHSDETECQYWPCNNVYTRCNNYKNCLNGSDEYGCLESTCHYSLYPCLSQVNLTLICLPMDQVDDNIIDCFGGTEERLMCQTSCHQNSCSDRNDTKCIPSIDLCRYFNTLSSDDDEEFCEKYSEICWMKLEDYASTIEVLVCPIVDMENKFYYFSLETARSHPPSTEIARTVRVDRRQAKNKLTIKTVRSEPATLDWMWRCDRGLSGVMWLGNDTFIDRCFCPPSYYGDLCEYQNQRVSLSLKLITVSELNFYTVVAMLVDETGDINSYEQIVYLSQWSCQKKININLLYSTRPKDRSKNYTVHIDVFDKYILAYHGRWYFPISFPFLPVNRLTIRLIIPFQPTRTPHNCNLTCNNGGQCLKYQNTETFFCRCQSNWSGPYCNTSVDCSLCSDDSICIGAYNNQSICVCSDKKVGPRCLIPSLCPSDYCHNNGTCVSLTNHVTYNLFFCICHDQFYGDRCSSKKRNLEIDFSNMEIPSHIVIYMITLQESSEPTTETFVKKLLHNQYIITIYTQRYIHMVFVKLLNSYYLVAVQDYDFDAISTTVTSNQQCLLIDELFNSTLLALPSIRRVKYYHLLCQEHSDLWCFYDPLYMCLCTLEHHANCFQFNYSVSIACRHDGICQNDGSCFQNILNCATDTLCVCTDCYFGDLCQFYAKGFGLTLDDILRYEMQPSFPFSQQRLSVKISAVVTVLTGVVGLVNGIFSYLTFRRKLPQQVGCGLYLYTSSITSILIMLVFTIKFWFFIFSQIDLNFNRTMLLFGCKSIEFCLKVLLYIDNWLNGCVAIERAYTSLAGLKLNKVKSTEIARRVIIIVTIVTTVSIIHEPLYRDLYDDKEEQRTWCVTKYSKVLQVYNSTIVLIHFLIPFVINMFSAVFIIITTARQRSISQTRLTFRQHLRKQLAEHKQILISPIALVILSSPRLIISLISSCVKSSRNPLLYIIGYFISFIPSVSMFIVFVLPSDMYCKEFKEAIQTYRRYLQ